METLANLPVLLFSSSQHWEEWLGEHHAQPTGIWLKIAKKEAAITTVSYAEALDVALCYGWIDAQKKPYDDAFWLQKFSPRRPKSGWSRINTEKATRLIEAGNMMPAGLREVEAARKDGRWAAAYASPSNVTIPDDFLAALDANPQAREFFETLDKTNRYAILYRIQTARKPETRQARIAKFISMLAAHEKIYS